VYSFDTKSLGIHSPDINSSDINSSDINSPGINSPDINSVAIMTRKILVVEDNPEIADLLAINLKDLNCDIEISNDGLEGLQKAQSNHYDLIILDLMLPGVDGIEICQKVRNKEIYTPILMLTAKSSELDRVLGLEVGADDYLTKPFSIRELIARVKALFRRVEAFGASNSDDKDITLRFNNLEINKEKRSVTISDKLLDLTAKEFDLLLHFAENPGHVYSRSQLLDQVWGYGHEGYEHTVNSHINRLRNKIEAHPAEPNTILTVWGVGYKFNPDLLNK